MTSLNDDDKNVEGGMARAAVQAQGAIAAGLKGSSGEFDELMQVNQVMYSVPPSLSIVSKRTRIVNNFMQTSYPTPQNTTMSLIFNTGEFYLQASTSYLAIQLAIQSTVANGDVPIAGNFVVGTNDISRPEGALFYEIPDGNICGIFEEIVLTSASGTELCREQKKGLHSVACFPYMYPDDYHDSVGSGQGSSWKASLLDGQWRKWPGYQNSLPIGGKNRRNFNTRTAADTYNPGHMFYIPLTQLLGVFNPYNKALIPASLISGARLDIRLSRPELVFSAGGTSATTGNVGAILSDLATNYVVQDIKIVADAVQLSDGVLKRLNEIAASPSGLNFLFDTYDWSQTTTNQASVECQVSQARSRIINSVCVVRDPSLNGNPYANHLASEECVIRRSGVQDGMPESNTTVLTYQAILGSLYFPQQPLTSFRDFFENSYYIWNKSLTDSYMNNIMTDEDFAGASGVLLDGQGAIWGVYQTYTDQTTLNQVWQPNYGRALYGMTAERSSYLQLSGLPISNARLLRHRFTFSNSIPRDISIFTSFSRMVRIYLGGRVLVRE